MEIYREKLIWEAGPYDGLNCKTSYPLLCPYDTLENVQGFISDK